jgi:hypothetical protein
MQFLGGTREAAPGTRDSLSPAALTKPPHAVALEVFKDSRQLRSLAAVALARRAKDGGSGQRSRALVRRNEVGVLAFE